MFEPIIIIMNLISAGQSFGSIGEGEKHTYLVTGGGPPPVTCQDKICTCHGTGEDDGRYGPAVMIKGRAECPLGWALIIEVKKVKAAK